MEVLQRTANRGSISTGGYEVDNSCKFEDANSEGLHKAISSMSRVTFTLSFWIKRTALGAQRIVGAGASGDNEVIIHFKSDNTLEFYSWEGAYAMRYLTNRVFRDTSAWYHLAFLVDTTNGTAGDRVKIYVNGVQETSFSATTVPGQNSQFDFTNNLYVGKAGAAADADFSGYMSEFVYLDGTQAASTDLGEVDSDSGIWKPIDVSGLTFGTNGAYLDFKDSANLGNDANGGTDFTETNITAADQATDTPTNNFATLNPLFKYPSSQVISQGATLVTRTSGSGLNKTFYTTQGVTSGKWYIEAQLSGSHGMVGATTMTSMSSYAPDGTYTGTQSTDIGYYSYNGQYYIGASGQGAWGEGNWNTTSHIMQIAIDMDNRKIYFGINNTYQASGNPAGNSNGITLPDTSDGYMLAFSYDGSGVWKLNTGGYTTMTISSAASDANGYGTFEYAPPTGYYALCTKNLAEYG